jgi:transposase
MTGRTHQGENKASLLELRTNPEPVIIMSDAAHKALMKIISQNNVQTLETNCLEHFRIRVEEISKNYPKESKYILNEISKVYKNDKYCKKENLDDLQRLDYHKLNSRPIIDELQKYFEKELKENPRAEPNGAYANKVLNYALKHWPRLTGFLIIPGAELDNNPIERKASTVARHFDNSRKYLTQHGASIGDFYMSLIETCKLNNINPLEYLTFCIIYRRYIPDDPELFLPWNFSETKKEFEEKLIDRPRCRIVSQHGAYIPKKEDLYAPQ